MLNGFGIPAIANLFSGEELYGKFLDLYANHTVYNNLKQVKRLGYLQYLDVLMALDKGLHAELEQKIRFSKESLKHTKQME